MENPNDTITVSHFSVYTVYYRPSFAKKKTNICIIMQIHLLTNKRNISTISLPAISKAAPPYDIEPHMDYCARIFRCGCATDETYSQEIVV